MKIKELVKYYDSEFTKLVFEKCVFETTKPYYILYLHNNDNEPEYFSTTFLHYLPFYVHSKESLEAIDEKDARSQLETFSKYLWNKNPIIKNRKTEVNGIYGELFLDYYLKIVKKYQTFVIYANLISYKCSEEIKGFDNFTFYLNENNIVLSLAEAKFVSSKSNAKNSLISDIHNHIKLDYFNDYASFIFSKGSTEDDGSHTIYDLLARMNSKIMQNSEKSFADILKEENIKLHFVYFAIFTSKEFSIEKYDDFYKELYEEFEQQVKREFSQFDIAIDVVLVPIKNQSIDIKREIDEAYHD